MKVLITKANTFVGKNLIENLKNLKEGKNRTRPELSIVDICGIEELTDENYGEYNDFEFVIILPETEGIEKIVEKYGNRDNTTIVYIGSVYQTEESLKAEKVLDRIDNALLYRFPQIIGKWQEPVEGVARLCYAVANDEEYSVEDNNKTEYLLFIDDFLEEMYDAMAGKPHRCDFPDIGSVSEDPTAEYDGRTPVPNDSGAFCYSPNTCYVTIGNIVRNLESFNRLNTTSLIPEVPKGSLAYKLYSMYLSYLPVRKMSYPLNMNVDNRGIFTELVKTANNGQISINIARPGIVRGQHWHNCKWEIFIVVSGHGLIQQRKIGTDEVINFEVRGEDMKAVIMLPGYSHNIINLEKDRDLVTVMYANEQFDAGHSDTFFEAVE